MVAAGTPTTSYFDTSPTGGLGVGYGGTTYGAERSFYQMAVPSAVDDSTVLSATFAGQVAHAGSSASTSHTVNLFSATGVLSSATTWNTMPQRSAGAYASSTFTTTSTSPALPVSWDVTSLLQNVVGAGSPSVLIDMMNSTEASSGAAAWVGLTKFYSITVNYDHAPGVPTPPTISPQYWASDGKLYTSSATPSFSTTSTDSDGDNVQVQVQVLSGSTVVASGTSPSAASGTTATWADPTPLADNGTYTFQMRAYDGTEYSAWTNWPSFTVETDTPPAPAISCPAYPAASGAPRSPAPPARGTPRSRT